MVRKFLRMGLARRLLIYSAATLLVAFVLLEAVRHLIFGLPEEFLVGHLLYVAGFALLLLGSLFLQRGLARRFLVYGAGMLLVSLALLEVVQRLAFGLPKEFLLRHLLYVAGFVLLLLGPLWWFLRRAVLRPIARLIEANRHVATGREADMFIPQEEIPDNEIGDVMRTRNEMLEEILQRNRRLSVLYTIDHAAAQSLDLEEILNDAMEATLEVLGIEACGIFLLEPDGETMTLRVHRGLSDEFVRNVQRIKLGEGVSGRAAAERRPVVLDVADYPSERLAPFIVHDGFQTLASTPLISAGELVGALNLGTRRIRAFPTEDLELLTSIGRQLGGAVRNAQLYERVQQELAERKRVEEERTRLSMAVEQAADTVMVTDLDGTIVYVNPAFERITGYSRAEVIGKNSRMLGSGKQDKEFFRAMWSALARGEVWSGHFINRRKDGTLYEEDAVISPVRDAAGKVINYVSANRDVTQEVALEAQLRQAQKMEAVGTLAGGVAHDFNNLLTTIIGFSQMTLLEEDLNPRVRNYIARIPEQGQRAAKLISQLLTFSRRATTERQPLQLLPLAKETVKMLERTVPENVAIRLKVSGEIATINADPTQMQQIVMNLCINASQAMPQGGELTLSLENVTLDEAYYRRYAYARPGDYVRLSVRDTGVGMTPEVQEHIFEPFFTTKGVGEGTGLGLAMVYGIVKMHEGHINVYSEVGKGSEFKVYLPAIPVETTRRVVSAEERPAGGTETILLVEDDASVLDTGQTILERLGYTVLRATNGEEALEMYRAHRDEIALVLTDMVMPKMGGQELYETLRQINPALKVLLMSSYSLKQDMADLRAGGLRGFVQKPFNLAKLGQAVRQALDG